MVRHILDHHGGSVVSSRFPRYEKIRRDEMPVGTGPVTKALMRRIKGPMNSALRARAFLRIDRRTSL